MKGLIFVVFLAFFISGCSTNSALIKQGAVVKQDKGIIVASVTHNGTGEGRFYYKKGGEKHPERMRAINYGWTTSPDEFPENPNKTGRLLAFEVEAGEYFLTDWSIFISFYGGYKIISPRDPIPLEFTVETGKITYIGNLHTETLYGKNVFGVSIAGSGAPSITDESETDLELLKKKYPNINNAWPVVIDIPDVGKWEK